MAGEFATKGEGNGYEATLKELARLARGTFAGHLGLRLVALDADMLATELPVRPQIAGPEGRLQPGIALALAEAVGTLASQGAIDRLAYEPACLDVGANHCASATIGETLRITARALCLGRRRRDWEVHLRTGDDRLICVAKLRIAIKARADDPVRAAA